MNSRKKAGKKLYSLAYDYENGNNVKQDIELAEFLYGEAALKGHIDANFALGEIYNDKREYKKSSLYTRKAAKKGHIKAVHNLGNNYLHGKGVKKSKKKAVHYFKIAAKKGHDMSLKKLEYIGKNIRMSEKNRKQLDYELDKVFVTRCINKCKRSK